MAGGILSVYVDLRGFAAVGFAAGASRRLRWGKMLVMDNKRIITVFGATGHPSISPSPTWPLP